MKLVSVQFSVVWCRRSQERVLMVQAIETRLSDPRLMLVFSTVLDGWYGWCRITTSKIFPEQIDNIFLVNIFGNEIPQPRSRLKTEICICAILGDPPTTTDIKFNLHPLISTENGIGSSKLHALRSNTSHGSRKWQSGVHVSANECWPEFWSWSPGPHDAALVAALLN